MKAGNALLWPKVKKKIRIADMDNERIDQIIDKHQGEASSLIQVMLAIQSENHWLPKKALERVSEKLQVPLTRIQHIATFYKAFSLVPKGRHEIHLCMGTACHVRGATRVLDTVQDLTGIKPGETDLDLKFIMTPFRQSLIPKSGLRSSRKKESQKN